MLEDKLRRVKLIVFDFDGIFTDGYLYIDETGKESIRCSRKDSWGIKMLRNDGLRVIVISTEKNPIVSIRCKKLKLKCLQGINNKAKTLKGFLATLSKDRNISFEEVCFVGDDINDLECMQLCGAKITVADGHPRIKKIADYVTKRKGGENAVREICELLIKAKKKK